MHKHFSIILILLIFSASCSKVEEKKQFEFSGGTFRAVLPFNPTDIDIENINDTYTISMIQQVLEGLYELNSVTLEPEMRLVKGLDISEDGLVYTFTVRDDVYFHPHARIGEKHKLDATDILKTFEHGCRSNKKGEPSVLYQTVFEGKVKGAEDYHLGKSNSISGLIVKDDKLIIELIKPDISFIEKLCIPSAKIVPGEMADEEEASSLIGTGPFVYKGTQLIDESTMVVLTKNINYYRYDDKNCALPYLDTVEFLIESRNLHQLADFEDGKLHYIEGIPPGRIAQMFETQSQRFFATPPEILLRRKPMLGTQYYALNMTSPHLKDKRVRQALNLALDREKLINEVLNDQAYGPGNRGLVPPFSFRDYDDVFNDSVGYSFKPEKAKKLLAEAGFPNGEGFPTLELKFDRGTIHSAIAGEFAMQMEQNLGVNVNIDGLGYQDLVEALNKGEGDIFRTSWYADYKSPETFLYSFNSFLVPKEQGASSKVNISRFKNEAFDKVYSEATRTAEDVKRLELFAKAEEILIDEVPFIVLWYEESISMTHAKVRNLDINEMDIYYLDRVYLKDWTVEEYESSLAKP